MAQRRSRTRRPPTQAAGNASANTSGRTAAKQRAPKGRDCSIEQARRSGYFREDAGRCLIYVFTPPKSAVVFVEIAAGAVFLSGLGSCR
jgi:hypothetical protein